MRRFLLVEDGTEEPITEAEAFEHLQASDPHFAAELERATTAAFTESRAIAITAERRRIGRIRSMSTPDLAELEAQAIANSWQPTVFAREALKARSAGRE